MLKQMREKCYQVKRNAILGLKETPNWVLIIWAQLTKLWVSNSKMVKATKTFSPNQVAKIQQGT